MNFAGYNELAIVFAAAASFLFGGAWYGVLSRQWIEATGKSEAELKASGRPMAFLFALTILAEFMMAVMLAGIVGHLGAGEVTLKNGLITGFLVWLGFVVTTLAVGHGYQGSRWSLTLIDAAHWLGVLLIQGAIIGGMGVG